MLGAEGRIEHDRQPLFHRLVLDLLVGGAHRDGIRLACRPCSTPIGRGATCALALWPLATSPSTRPSSRRQPSGANGAAPARPRTAGRGGEQPVEHLELALGIGRVEVGDEFDHAAAGILHAERDAEKSSSEARSDGVGSPFTVRWFRVREVEKPKRPVTHRLRRQRPHLRHFFRRRLFQRAARSPITKTRSAPCGSWAPRSMSRGLGRAHRDTGRTIPRPVEGPRRARRRECPRRFHQFDQTLAILDLHRREPDTAIAHHRRGDAVPARRLQVGIPGGLTVIVGMDVDEAGRDQHALAVDLLPALPAHLADSGNPAVLHATSASLIAAPVPSATLPPRTTRSKSAMFVHSGVAEV